MGSCKKINEENEEIQDNFQKINANKNNISHKCKELEEEYSFICNQMEYLCGQRTDIRKLRSVELVIQFLFLDNLNIFQ